MNWLDKTISWLDPAAGFRRARMRAAAEAVRFSYEGARTGRRTDGWISSGASANYEIGTGLKYLRERSRELIRNNHYAAKGALEFQTKTVGAGIVPRTPDEIVQQLWTRWSAESSADGLAHFYAIQALVARAMFESGECLVRFRPRTKADKLTVPLQVQVLESDFLDLSKTQQTNTGYIIQGVEFDMIGRRVAYWLFPQHPGEVAVTTWKNTTESVRVPRFDEYGFEQVLHVYEILRPGQVRGVPHLASVMLAMRDLDDWETAELVRKKTEACLAAIISPPDNGDTLTPTVTDANGNKIETFQPGMIAYSTPGSVTFNTPTHAGGYEDYKRSRVRDFSAGIGMPYEILRGDLSQVNYSSYRAGLLGFRDRIESLQWNVFIPQLCVPTWKRFVAAAQLADLIPDGEFPVEWAPPAFDLLDRGAEAKADSEMLTNGTMTWPQAVARQGEDPERQMQEIENWKPRLDAAGVVFGKQKGGANAGNQPQAQ